MAQEQKLRIGTFNLQNLQLPDKKTYPKAKPFTQEELIEVINKYVH